MKKNKHILLLFLLFTGSFNVLSQSINSSIIGRWSGNVIEVGRSDYYTVNLTIHQANPGDMAGTVSYPDYNCGGSLKLLDVNYEKGIYMAAFDEQLTFGQADCINDGRIRVGAENGKLFFQWLKNGLDFSASGWLEKQ